jgi:hypothetical protein
VTASLIPDLGRQSGPPITSFRDQRAYLANPYRCPVVFEGIEYPGAEWAFQAAKSLDPGFRMYIAAMARWQDAKAAGRSVVLRPTWDGVRRVVMMRILLDKFSHRNPGLAAALVTTGTAVLVEGNDWGDDFWGAVSPEAIWRQAGTVLPTWDTGDGRFLAGHNWLGQQLMMIRDLIRPEGLQ